MPKGIYVRTKEHNRKNSESNKGRLFTEEHKRKLSGALSKKGQHSNAWRGGRNLLRTGYVLIYKPEHPHCNNAGYVREHRLVIEESLGRYLLPEEIIHHLNGIRDDNRIENLCVVNKPNHETCTYIKKLQERILKLELSLSVMQGGIMEFNLPNLYAICAS